MEMTSNTFEFVDNLNEIKLYYTEPSQHIGECWEVGELQFEITDCKFNSHLQFSITVSSDKRNINNISEASIWDICLEHIHQKDKSYASIFNEQLIVTFDGDLHSFEGYEWQDDIDWSLKIIAVLPLEEHGKNKWNVAIEYRAKYILDTYDIARAFEREFKCKIRTEMVMTHAVYQQIINICSQHGIKPVTVSIEE